MRPSREKRQTSLSDSSGDVEVVGEKRRHKAVKNEKVMNEWKTRNLSYATVIVLRYGWITRREE